MQITAEKVSYYCFNRHCKSSAFNIETVKVTELPLNEAVLMNTHECDTCGHGLISLFDIDMKKIFLWILFAGCFPGYVQAQNTAMVTGPGTIASASPLDARSRRAIDPRGIPSR